MCISIHALREEGDRIRRIQSRRSFQISIHALREEGDLQYPKLDDPELIFLSTPSARRATEMLLKDFWLVSDFYPRPPRGGRPPAPGKAWRATLYFYPRPPRGGRRKTLTIEGLGQAFLSTPSARRATDPNTPPG